MEIVRFPDHASIDDFQWRVSRARVAATGPFSLFPGVDRTLAIIDGAGITLMPAGQQTVTLDRKSSPYTFSGDCAVEGQLINGAVDDLNVMSRRGYFRHSMLRMRTNAPGALQPRSDTMIVFVGSGAIEVRAGRSSESLGSLDALIMSEIGEAVAEVIPRDVAELYVIDLWRC